MRLAKISIAGTKKSHSIVGALQECEALTASEQGVYNTATAVTAGNPSQNRGGYETMRLKMPLHEAKARALELMRRGYH